jgi:hypothetical protein
MVCVRQTVSNALPCQDTRLTISETNTNLPASQQVLVDRHESADTYLRVQLKPSVRGQQHNAGRSKRVFRRQQDPKMVQPAFKFGSWRSSQCTVPFLVHRLVSTLSVLFKTGLSYKDIVFEWGRRVIGARVICELACFLHNPLHSYILSQLSFRKTNEPREILRTGVVLVQSWHLISLGTAPGSRLKEEI